MISIIIPTYNRAQLISRAIESVINQTNPNWELIIVDDGSTDNTAEIIKKYLSDKIHYFQIQNSGATVARNRGADKAKGSHLVFLDSDDELFINYVEKMLKYVSEYSIIFSGITQIRTNKKYGCNSLPKGLGKLFNYNIGKFTNGVSYCIHRDLFKKIGKFDENVKAGQHTELSYRLVPYIVSGNIKFISLYEPLAFIHIHKGERIRTNSDAKYLGAKYVINKHFHLLKTEKKRLNNYLRIIIHEALKRRKILTVTYFYIIYLFYKIL